MFWVFVRVKPQTKNNLTNSGAINSVVLFPLPVILSSIKKSL